MKLIIKENYDNNEVYNNFIMAEESAPFAIDCVPVVENSNTSLYHIDSKYLKTIAEDYDLELQDAFDVVCEEDSINPDYAALIVEEYELLEDPTMLNDFEHRFFMKECSSNSPEYKLAEACFEEYLNTFDESVFDAILDEAAPNFTLVGGVANNIDKPKPTKPNYPLTVANGGRGNLTTTGSRTSNAEPGELVVRGNTAPAVGSRGTSKSGNSKPNIIDITAYSTSTDKTSNKNQKQDYSYAGRSTRTGTNTGTGESNSKSSRLRKIGRYGLKGLAALGVATAAYDSINGAIKGAQNYRNRPRTWLAKKIAALRKLYSKWMNKASNADPKKANIIKRACAKLLKVIDKLMAKLQQAAN